MYTTPEIVKQKLLSWYTGGGYTKHIYHKNLVIFYIEKALLWAPIVN